MNIKFSKMMTAFIISLLLALGLSGGVSGTQSGILVGENNVINPVISVVVPTNLNFTLDPLELESSGNQISPANYFFINKTEAPVRITLNIEVILNNGASFVDDPTQLEKDNDAVKDKKLFFGILGADSFQERGFDYDLGSSGSSYQGVYDVSKDTFIPFDPVSKTASIAFALAPAVKGPLPAETMEPVPLLDENGFIIMDEEGNPVMGNAKGSLPPDSKSIALFQFYAEMNTYAPWEDGDVEVSASYVITPLRSSTYEGYFNNGRFTLGGWGTQLKGEGQMAP